MDVQPGKRSVKRTFHCASDALILQMHNILVHILLNITVPLHLLLLAQIHIANCNFVVQNSSTTKHSNTDNSIRIAAAIMTN